MPRPRGRTRLPRLSRMDAAVDAMGELGFPEAKVKKKVKELLKEYGGDDCWPFIEESSYKVLLDSFLDEEDNQEEDARDRNLLEDESHGDKQPIGSSSGAPDTQKDIVALDITETAPLTAASAEAAPLLAASSPLQDNIPSVVAAAAAAHRRRHTHCYGWIDSDEDDIVDDFSFQDNSHGDKEPTGSSSGATDTQKDIVAADITETAPITAASAEAAPLLAASSPLQDNIPSVVAAAAAAHRRRHTHCYGWIDSDEDNDVDDFINLTPMTVQGRGSLDVITWKKKRRSRWDLKPGDP